MIREDRELLAELARLNSDVTPFAMRMIDGSITAAEQREFADRLVRLGRWFHERVNGIARAIEKDTLTTGTNGNDQIECRPQWGTATSR
ncbi:MAG: hypothetical protein ACRDS9_11305 [Pseudonocardiaceae bacterium]